MQTWTRWYGATHQHQGILQSYGRAEPAYRRNPDNQPMDVLHVHVEEDGTDVAGPALACPRVRSDGPSRPLDLVVAEVVVVNH
jgi:hypothetical protein